MNPPPNVQAGISFQPIHLLAGGGRSRRKSGDPLLADCLALAGKPAPEVAYVGAASGDDPSFFKYLSGLFREAGADRVHLVPLSSPRADADAACHQLSRADLVFISGGDVEAGMQCLRRHRLIPFLRRLHSGGKPFFGLSAGSIMLCHHWVRWTDPDDDGSARLFQCLGLAPLVCDTHAEKEDWVELKTLLHLMPEGNVGYGIPAGGGLRVSRPDCILALGKPISRFRRERQGIRRLPPLEPDGHPALHPPLTPPPEPP